MLNLETNKSLNNTTKISFFEKLAFGGGGFAANILIQSINMYLIFFYTDVFKISAITAGTLFLVARVVDSIVDFSMGYIIDRTKSKWGKFRPYVMFGCLPLCVLGILCFTVPEFNDIAKVVYAYVTYLLVMVFYSIVTIPTTAILPAITQEPTERIKLNNFAQFLGMTGMMIVAVGTMPLVGILGGGNQAKGFFFTISLYSVVSFILFVIWSFKVRERVVVKKQHEKIKLKEAFPIILKNKYLLLLSGAFVFFMSGFTIRNNSQMYYLTYSLQRPDLVSIVGLLSMLPLILIILLVPFIVGKIGKRNALILGMIIVIVANTSQYFVGFDNVSMLLTLTVISAIGSGLFVPLVWGLLPDTVDYAEWKFGKRAEGIISSTFIFLQKCSSGVAGYVAGVGLVVFGYIPNVIQSVDTMKGISFLYNVAGSILSIIAVVFMIFYDLDNKKYNKIIQELHERENEN
ncbi:MFS transporter [Clostridium sp. SHJSY1]|uniref:MFS transporter n=1 Tax=Clostridium sp. SHJSY1 TaxID=2942483 RepID=UPI002874A2DF|nr:MFS transporter [Clostridium sp. SHJSY1]MDS0527436.1 MFS transporter [Clostridium sp. SHJSY1]